MSAFAEYIPGRFTQPLDAARAEHARGRRVVGYIGDDAPVELILGANALPVRLEVLAGMPTPGADRYLESSFGPAYRSYLEQWLQGELDFLDAVVFPRSNDSAQRLYYYVCELQRRSVCKGPRPLIYDVARIDRATSREHMLAATASLAEALGVSMSALEPAVQKLHSRVAFARRLAALRMGSSAISGSDAVQAWRALQLDWTDQFEHTVREWSSIATRRAYFNRFVLAGSTPPDDRLHRAVEAGGGTIVDEFFDGSMSQCVARWGATGSTLDAVTDAYRNARSTAAAWLDSPDLLLHRVRAAYAHGVILWFVEEDEGIVWEVPRQIDRLRQAGIAVLALTRQSWAADDAVLARITKFAQLGGET